MSTFDGYGIYGDVDELAALVKGIKIGEEALLRATVRAVNKTATSVRSEASRLIRKDYRVLDKDVKSRLKIRKANFSRIEAIIFGSQSPGVPLYKFAPTPKRTPSTKRTKAGGYTPKSGIKAMVKKGQRKVVRDAFIQRMSSGHIGVFKRVENQRMSLKTKRTVIEELYGPSPLRLLDSDHIQIPLDDFTGELLEKNTQREAEYYLKKAGLL